MSFINICVESYDFSPTNNTLSRLLNAKTSIFTSVNYHTTPNAEVLEASEYKDLSHDHYKADQ